MQDNADEIASAWFEKAMTCYIERHQGCPWCGGAHCVFRTRRSDREQYACSACDFFTCHTFQDNNYFVTLGETTPSMEGVNGR
jgi:hypothetical protein